MSSIVTVLWNPNLLHGVYIHMQRKTAFVKLAALLLAACVVAHGQRPRVRDRNNLPKKTNRELALSAHPVKTSFTVGERVLVRLKLTNVSNKPLFVSNYLPLGELVGLTVRNRITKAEPEWCGGGIIRSQSYSADSFAVLQPGASVVRLIDISCDKSSRHHGYVLPMGDYSGRVDYSMEPKEYFAPAARSVEIPDGVVKSHAFTFMVEAQSRRKISTKTH